MSANKEVEYGQAINYIHHMYETRHKAFHFMLIVNAALLAIKFNSKTQTGMIGSLPLSVFGFLVTTSLLLFAVRNARATAKYEGEAMRIEKELGFSLITSAHHSAIGGMNSGVYLTGVYIICALFWLCSSIYPLLLMLI
ncbi:hypothetical protein CWC05_10705 [Pseudoalteromonas ruthenica]|uniref:Uncharacterized protein n=1 Tax=Pseudoalteromonas ruthenica TaxID=151081 RepID=A0A5S3Z3X6_9GAMM|nr:hypothetical protein [Pseudoalteromonas ruthenica]TMP86938.1 hypothetical protein CWC05_10705 [Pseudoalteromonas ruthenica]